MSLIKQKSTLPLYKKQSNPKQKIYGVYTQSMLTAKIILSINEIGKNTKQNLERMISKTMEGKCINEGYIEPGSAKVMTYSCGTVNGEKIEFQTIFECMVCHPVEGMLIECITKTITKAGIHAEVIDKNGNIPIIVFIARDHHYKDKSFSDIKENMKIVFRVIGVRFEYNDSYICVIGKLANRNEYNSGGDSNSNEIEEL